MRARVVLDANIFASALMNPHGSPANVLRMILQNSPFELVLSESIIEELRRIFFYPKVRKRIPKTDDEISLFLDALVLKAHIVIQRYTYEVIVQDDPDDDIYVIAALESRARYLITGDQHLLKLKSVEKVEICTSSEFLELENSL